MSIHSWKSQFGHKVTGYDAIEAQGLSELGYALKHNQILQNEYMSWARSAYELCSLDMKFFQSQKPPFKLYESVKEIYPWSVECLPVARWDDQLIIAGLEKPDDLPAEHNAIFLLAPLSGLEVFWEAYHQERDSSEESEDETSENSPQEASLEGINISESTKIDLSSLSISRVAPAPASASATTSESKEIRAKPTVIENNLGPVDSAVPKNVSQPVIPELEVKAQPTILEPNIQVVSSDDYEEPTIRKHEVKAQPKVVAIATPDAPVSVDLLLAALDQYQKHYEKRAFVIFDLEQNVAQARYFPSSMMLTQNPKPHSLDPDSFLKIVLKTQKPYHGYPVKTPVVESFFKEINEGVLPENITAIPLINQDQVIGIFLGWGSKATYTLAVLRDIQKVVDDLSAKLGWVKVDAA